MLLIIEVQSSSCRLQGEELPYNGFAHRENRATGEGLSDLCTLFRARAFFVDVAVTFCSLVRSSPFVMCIELVGDRFLRRMVRILVVCVRTFIICCKLWLDR